MPTRPGRRLVNLGEERTKSFPTHTEGQESLNRGGFPVLDAPLKSTESIFTQRLSKSLRVKSTGAVEPARASGSSG